MVPNKACIELSYEREGKLDDHDLPRRFFEQSQLKNNFANAGACFEPDSRCERIGGGMTAVGRWRTVVLTVPGVDERQASVKPVMRGVGRLELGSYQRDLNFREGLRGRC